MHTKLLNLLRYVVTVSLKNKSLSSYLVNLPYTFLSNIANVFEECGIISLK